MATSRLSVALVASAIVLFGGGAAFATGSGLVADRPSPTQGPSESRDGDQPPGQEKKHKKDKGGVGPDAAGPAHRGLCNAWSHVKDTPGNAANSTAFRNLQEVGCDDVALKPKGGSDKDDAEDGTNPGKGQGKGKGLDKPR